MRVVALIHLLQGDRGALAGTPCLVGNHAGAAPGGVAGVAVAVAEHSALYGEYRLRTVVALHVEEGCEVDVGKRLSVLDHVEGVGGSLGVERVAVIAVVGVRGHRHGKLRAECAGLALIETIGVAGVLGEELHRGVKVFHGEAVDAGLGVAGHVENACGYHLRVVFDHRHVMPYLSQHVVAVSAEGARLADGLVFVGLGDGAVAYGDYVVDYAVGIEDHVVEPFPALVEVGIDGGVGAEIPLTLVAVGVEHVAVDHVHLPLEVHVEVAPGLGSVERHGG